MVETQAKRGSTEHVQLAAAGECPQKYCATLRRTQNLLGVGLSRVERPPVFVIVHVPPLQNCEHLAACTPI
jgi:hypothetical protein